MSQFKKEEGRRGEDFAVSFLQKKGWQIVERNFHIRGGEIDIIAIEYSSVEKVHTLVFVEVKTRSSTAYGTPLEAIGYHKLRTLIKASQFYKIKHPELPDLMRIDAISVMLDGEGQLLDIELVKNIS